MPKRAMHTDAHNKLQVSLPTPAIFTSGSRIPFTLSFAFPSASAMPALLIPNIRIELIKRTRLSRLGGLEIAQREAVVGRADIENIKEEGSGYGVTHLSGSIPAGREGRESSWKVYTMADVQYIVRIVVSPPRSMQANVASWKGEVEVRMVTDPWGTLERELIATGGTPMPALALAQFPGPFGHAMPHTQSML